MKLKKAFTLIELLVVIAIIGLLATLSVLALNNARAKSRDAKRLSDVKQIRTALELYFNSTGHYPTAEEFNSGKIEYYSPSHGTTTYMMELPSAPTPSDGVCSSADNVYTYTPNTEGSDYDLNFCVAKSPADLPDGKLIAFSGGIRGGGESGGGEETPAPECFDTFTSCALAQVGPNITTDSVYYGAINMTFVSGVPYIIYNSGNNGYVAVKSFNSGTSTWDDVAQISTCTSCADGVSAYVSGNNIYVGINDYYGGTVYTSTSVNSWASQTTLGTRSAILAKDAPYAASRVSGAPGITAKYFNGTGWVDFFGPISNTWTDTPMNIIVDGTNIYIKYLDYGTGSYKPYLASFNSGSSSWDLYPADNEATMNNDVLFFYNGHPTLVSDLNASAPFVRYFNGSAWTEVGDVDTDVPTCLHIGSAAIWNDSIFLSCANSSWSYKLIKYNGSNWVDTNVPLINCKLIANDSDDSLYCYGSSADNFSKVYKLELN